MAVHQQDNEAACATEAVQFGHALSRVSHHLRHANPRCGPVRTSKHDIKDGFYQMFLRPRDSLRLSIILPKHPGEPPLIGIPMACTMVQCPGFPV